MPKRLSPFVLASIAMLSWSGVVLAQEANPNCPPGAWFCDDAAPSPPAAQPELPPPQPTPPPTAQQPQGPRGSGTPVVPGAQLGQPPVVIYQQAPTAPPPVVVVRRGPPYYTPPPPPPPPKRFRHRTFALNLRLAGVMMDSDSEERAGMGGVGFSFRLRPERYFAVDFGFDLLSGRDYNGNRRSEVPFTISALMYANPRDMAQFYMLAGLGWSHARVDVDGPGDDIRDYSYFGGQLGAGVEFRLSRAVSLHLDLIGFIRGRTDRDARNDPEFVDVDGRTTNTSGGGLLRGGVLFYW